ncbi:methyltransferase domain-containing protein [Streptomyces sp. NPDC087851]|uniref:methyltransferase domain-containing protein n=1 Tax=Streptomyces sp. NPDC087851 TaxID=3365810 RepID=UPI0037F8D50D
MLELLGVREGQRVLELGAATGYNAAWLAHRLGSDQVTSVDIDPVLAEQAARNLDAAGFHPHVFCGPGEYGWPDNAPYDRVIATYTVPEVPYAWVEQAPTGRIITPWGGSFFPYSFAVLEVTDGEAHGRFTGYPAFMRTRHNRPHRGHLADFLHHREEAAESRTDLSPLTFDGDPDALFFIGLDLPDAWYVRVDADDDSGEATFWILADDRSSWAAADHVPGGRRVRGHAVRAALPVGRGGTLLPALGRARPPEARPGRPERHAQRRTGVAARHVIGVGRGWVMAGGPPPPWSDDRGSGPRVKGAPTSRRLRRWPSATLDPHPCAAGRAVGRGRGEGSPGAPGSWSGWVPGCRVGSPCGARSSGVGRWRLSSSVRRPAVRWASCPAGHSPWMRRPGGLGAGVTCGTGGAHNGDACSGSPGSGCREYAGMEQRMDNSPAR